MTDKIIVLVTGPNPRACKRMARALLEKKLIACASIVPQILSLYHWKGKLVDERECMMILKSSRDIFDALRAEIEKLHEYSIPEIIALPVIDGAPNYLNWVGESLQSPPD